MVTLGSCAAASELPILFLWQRFSRYTKQLGHFKEAELTNWKGCLDTLGHVPFQWSVNGESHYKEHV